MGMTGGGTAQEATPGVGQLTPAKPVLELYTSQGCNSCPPADTLFETYARRSDLVALTLPVDYWDYLGWKDTLASPKHSARQRAYAKARGDGRIYTPQVVVNGVTHVVGSSAGDIEQAIKDVTSRAGTQVPVAVRVEAGRLIIDVGEATTGIAGLNATIWLASLQKEAEVPVRSGENRGRSLKYFNVVRDLTPVGMWSGKPARFELVRDAVKLPETESCAVLIQTGKAGPIIGSAMLAAF